MKHRRVGLIVFALPETFVAAKQLDRSLLCALEIKCLDKNRHLKTDPPGVFVLPLCLPIEQEVLPVNKDLVFPRLHTPA